MLPFDRTTPLSLRAKRAVQQLFTSMGFRLQRMEAIKPVDLRGEEADPRLFAYRGGARPILIDVPTRKTVSLSVYPLEHRRDHPFCWAVTRALDSSRPKKAIRRVLRNYYELVQPRDAADWLGIEPDMAPKMVGQPPWARVLPWQSTDIKTRRRRAIEMAPVEHRNGGAALDISHGWKTFGPVSEELLDVETNRLYSLMCSIRDRGYQRHDGPTGDLTASILWRNSDEWKCKIMGGAHRIAVLRAMDYREVPVRITRFVRPGDVEIWPNVDNGIYDRQAALQLFDRLVDGRLPPVARQWQQR